MDSVIYYFSGTGNSLALAKEIAEKTGAEAVPIPSVMGNKTIKPGAGTIGIVFPVYHATFGRSGIPYLVRKFIDKLEDLDSAYIYAVCTHAGMPGKTAGNLDKILRSKGGELAAGFTVKMSVPYGAFVKIGNVLFNTELRSDIDKDNKKREILAGKWEKKLEILLPLINKREKAKLETPGKIKGALMEPFFLLQKQMATARYRQLSGLKSASFGELTLHADKGFVITDRCNGCGICSRVCPAGNIEMTSGKPVRLHRCENCSACFHWCPGEAVTGEIVRYEKRYRNPAVKLSDVLLR